VRADARGVCGVDLARATGVVPNEELSFRAYSYRARGAKLEAAPKASFRAVAAPHVCVDIPHRDLPVSLPPDAAERYVVLDLTNGYAKGPLRVHLYDGGEAGGYRLAGVERPDSLTRPE
jgi:hypothetical protein